MRYKLNLKYPERKAKLNMRRLRQSLRKGLDASTLFTKIKYVPGNGVHHKLGKVNEG